MTTATAPLAGKVAIVTGGAKNIGRAIALTLAGNGAAVGVVGKTDKESLQKTAQEIRACGVPAAAVLADIANAKGAARAIKKIADTLGAPSILINNAALRRNVAFGEMSFDEWRAVTGVILDGAFLCSREVLPHMKKTGNGTIVNIGGVSAHLGAAGRAHVISAKAGVVGLTRALATELAKDNIRVNCIVPGEIATARGASAGKKPAHPKGAKPLISKHGKVGDIAKAVAFLAGPDAKYITGQTLHISGGMFFA